MNGGGQKGKGKCQGMNGGNKKKVWKKGHMRGTAVSSRARTLSSVQKKVAGSTAGQERTVEGMKMGPLWGTSLQKNPHEGGKQSPGAKGKEGPGIPKARACGTQLRLEGKEDLSHYEYRRN